MSPGRQRSRTCVSTGLISSCPGGSKAAFTDHHAGPTTTVATRTAAMIGLHRPGPHALDRAIPSASARTTTGTRNKVVR